VPIHRDLALALAAWRGAARTGYVLITRRGTPLDEDTMPHIYARWLPSLGIQGCNAHRLRRTCANELRRSGADIRDIQEVLGHDSPETTDIYLDPDPNLVRPAIDRLPDLADWEGRAPRLTVVRGERARA
jgi:integrase